MEEIKGTEALEREILEDAGKRADRIVRKAREEAERLKSASVKSLEDRLAGLRRQYQERSAQLEKETSSRLPLEKTRLKARFIDETMRKSVREFLGSLDPAALGDWCVSEFGKRSGLLSGKAATLSWKGIDAGQAEGIVKFFPADAALSIVENPDMKGRGIVAKSLDGRIMITLTEGQIEEWLLDEKRGELASSLFPSASFEKIGKAEGLSPHDGGEEGKK